ncbi:MAG TPA: GNAT family N-acetyltransferase [Acidimicrobiales bacterium]
MSLTYQTTPTRPATRFDRSGVAAALSGAFVDDPVFEWIFPDRATRVPLLPPLFEAFAEAFARHDETHVVVTQDAVTGVAMWSPPGVEPVHPDDERALEERVAPVLGEHADRWNACLELFGGAHPSEPAWFLQFLGVDPGHQGCGLGSVLLRDVLARADAAGEAAYLEATSERNRALYERHGFRSVGELTLPDGPTAFAMWREPGGSR